MVAAALTPRVRILVVCDAVTPSDTEEDVYTLEGVRQRIHSKAFPCKRDLSVFLLVSCPRRGRYQGSVRLVNNQTTRVVRWAAFSITFQHDNEMLSFWVDVANSRFPEPGEHSMEVWFTARSGASAQKGELPFHVIEEED
jgi:hypothetical protein